MSLHSHVRAVIRVFTIGMMSCMAALAEDTGPPLPPPHSPPSVLRRWFDDAQDKTTLRAIFERRPNSRCFTLGALLALRHDRVQFTFPPRALDASIGFGSDVEGTQKTLELADGLCRIRLRATKEVLVDGKWVALAPL